MFTHAQFSTSLMLWYNMETFSALVTLYVEGPITDGFPTQRSSDAMAMRMPICDICPHEDFFHFVAPLALEQSSQVAKLSISKLHGSTSLQKTITNKKMARDMFAWFLKNNDWAYFFRIAFVFNLYVLSDNNAYKTKCWQANSHNLYQNSTRSISRKINHWR